MQATPAIAAHFIHQEQQRTPPRIYFASDELTCCGGDVTPRMYGITTAWLWTVCAHLKSRAETFCLATDMLQRLLLLQTRRDAPQLTCTTLQMVAALCLSLAERMVSYEGMDVLDAREITENCATLEAFKKTEISVLFALDFRLSIPTVWSFARAAWRRCCTTTPCGIDGGVHTPHALWGWLLLIGCAGWQSLQFRRMALGLALAWAAAPTPTRTTTAALQACMREWGVTAGEVCACLEWMQQCKDTTAHRTACDSVVEKTSLAFADFHACLAACAADTAPTITLIRALTQTPPPPPLPPAPADAPPPLTLPPPPCLRFSTTLTY